MSRKINKEKIITDLKAISDKAFRIGASNATVEMIGNAVTRLEYELKDKEEVVVNEEKPTI